MIRKAGDKFLMLVRRASWHREGDSIKPGAFSQSRCKGEAETQEDFVSIRQRVSEGGAV